MKRRKKTPGEKEALMKLCDEHTRNNDSEKNLRKKLRNVANTFPLLGYKAAQKWAWDYLERNKSGVDKSRDDKDHVLLLIQSDCAITQADIDKEASQMVQLDVESDGRILEPYIHSEVTDRVNAEPLHPFSEKGQSIQSELSE